MGTSVLLLLALFAISYCDANGIPVITTTVVELREDIPQGEFAFQIEASDPDNDPLTYSMFDPAQHFTVNSASGQAFINNPLDRETKEYFTVDVIVNDGNYDDVFRKVTIIVLDANDNAPMFLNLPYNIDLPENTDVGSTVLTVSAVDHDLGLAGIVAYRIDQVIPGEGEAMFSISSNLGHITLNEKLSFTDKSAFYQIKITASDGGGPLHENDNYIQSTSTTAFLTVMDVPNLDPQFLNLPNTATVLEHSPAGTSVFTVQARDPDTGINDKINFSIEDANKPDLFEINRDSGVISVKSEIDREALLDIDAVVQLTIKATEENVNVDNIYASATATLSISIGDVNDNPPIIYKCEGECVEESNFAGDIDENSSAGLSVSGINMQAKDNDQGQNSFFLLELQGPDKEAFSVAPPSVVSESAVQILVKDPSALDYETKKTMTVQVVAKDPTNAEYVSTATVTIQINDLNDNSPEFEEQTYKLSVFEHCEDGTSVGTVTATDADELDQGKLTYRLLPDSILQYFDVQNDTGKIFVKNGDLLDRERTSSYSPTLQAKDTSGNVGSTVLEITVQDINDQTPRFYREYEVFILENNKLTLQMEARDDDEPDTHNSRIQYGIVDSEYSGNFTIGRDDGTITSNGNLDREAIDIELKGVIKLNVTATDMGAPPLTGWTMVTINVDDVNDNSPVYLDKDYTFHVKESEPGILVGNVFARDADQTEYNNRISFRINGLGTFLVISELNDTGSYRGSVMVDPDVELDYESDRKEYELIVEATDLGRNMDTAIVKVVVVDVNDVPPVFPPDLTMTIDENSPFRTKVGTIKGSDVDTNHSLIYEMVSTKCHCNKTWGPCEEEWFTLESNGDIFTSAEFKIDYENCDTVDMTARVVDLYTEKRSNSTEGTVMIKIVDLNDNEPVFVPVQEFFVVLSENIEQGSYVASVYATDEDSGENAKINFEVVEVTFASSNPDEPPQTLGLIFYAETNEQPDVLGNYNGVIKSHQSLDPDKKGKYLVKVRANNLDLSSETVLELITVDKSFKVGLRFEASVVDVNVNLPNIRGLLTGATKAMVHVVKVSTEKRRNIARNEVTLVEAYFVFPNGTALDSDTVFRILNTQDVYEQYGTKLQEYGLTGILTGVQEVPEDRTDLYIMIGLIAALVIVLTVMTTSLLCLRRSYKRKLKAAKAMNTAAMEAADNDKGGPVVPGTNKYTREGANPVLNLNIDSATDLGFDEDETSADRESLNSLDMDVDMDSEKDTMGMTMIAEEDEDMDEPTYVEPLGAALAQREKKREPETSGITIANPAFSTTDL